MHRAPQISALSGLLTLCIIGLIGGLLGTQSAVADSASPSPATSPHRLRPAMGEFIGLNVHTVQFKPDLYAPVCRLLRDYHPVGWDFPNEDPTGPTKFPMAANGVPWNSTSRALMSAPTCASSPPSSPRRLA